MMIAKNRVVAFHFTLKDLQGEQLDTSRGELPMVYLHGHHNLVPGLEQAMEGRSIGDHFDVIVQPQDGYGMPDPELVQQIPLAALEGVDEVQVGMQFQAETADGEVAVQVIAIEDDTVTVDGNHPLAGEPLHFFIEIRNVRDASEEELELGYPDP